MMYAHNETVHALTDTQMNTRLLLSAHLHTCVTGDLVGEAYLLQMIQWNYSLTLDLVRRGTAGGQRH